MVGLADAGVVEIRIVNRTVERAEALAALAGIAGLRVTAHGLAGAEAALSGAGLLLNTSTLGMTGQPPLELDLENLPENEVKVLVWGTNPIRHGADTKDVAQIIRDTSKQVDWVLPCVPHADEEINKEVEPLTTMTAPRFAHST